MVKATKKTCQLWQRSQDVQPCSCLGSSSYWDIAPSHTHLPDASRRRLLQVFLLCLLPDTWTTSKAVFWTTKGLVRLDWPPWQLIAYRFFDAPYPCITGLDHGPRPNQKMRPYLWGLRDTSAWGQNSNDVSPLPLRGSREKILEQNRGSCM